MTATLWTIVALIGTSFAVGFAFLVIGERVDKALVAYAKRREADSAEYVTWVEDYR